MKSSNNMMFCKLLANTFGFSRAFVALLSITIAAQAFGLGLGTINVETEFGQPFVGSVQLINARGFDETNVTVSVASRDTHRELGIPYTTYLDSISTELNFPANGVAEVLLRSSRPLQEPFLEFALELRSPNGRIAREYTVLVNMPNSSIPLQISAPDPLPSTRDESSSKPPIPHASVHTLEWGDTLSNIAERIEDRSVSHSEAVATLNAHNGDLIQRRGDKGLQVGDKILVPAKEVFTQPSAPIRQPAGTSNDVSNAANQAATNRDADTSGEVGSPALRAETRLRALGYASLQQKAAGENTNPVVASGAAATIVERLIKEQGEDSPEALTNISRLTEGLNKISDISRVYQQRLDALEETAKNNADKLASLIEERDRLLAEQKPLPADDAQTSDAAAIIADASSAQTNQTSFFSRIPLWIYLLIFFVIMVALIVALFMRYRKSQAVYLDQLQQEAEMQRQQRVIAEKTPAPTADPEDDAEETVVDEDSGAEAETQESTLEKPFYERDLVEDIETDPEELFEDEDDDEIDLDSELDEELKLISSFERNLAAETESRSQAKQRADASPMPNAIQADDMAKTSETEEPETLLAEPETVDEDEILEFNLDSLEGESDDFVLEESQTGEDALILSEDNEMLSEETGENVAAEAEEELAAPAAAEEELTANLGSELSAETQQTQSSESQIAANHSGFAASADFHHINPVEAIEVVNTKLQAAKDAGNETTLFYIDIDKFDSLEAEIGIIKAEKVASAVASHIFDRIENPITLKRFKQNAFIVLLQGGRHQHNLDFGLQIASAMAGTPIEVSGETFFVTLSIGIVPVASGFSDSSEIIDLGRGLVDEIRNERQGNGAKLCELDPDFAHNDASIVREGRRLLNDDGFVTLYRPITALKGDPIEFYQARLVVPENTANKGLPENLVSRLADTDLSTELDCAHIMQTLVELNQHLSSHVGTRVFVTISARSATDNFFKNWFEKTIFAEGVHPERIIFQMTEQSISRNLNGLVEFRDFAHRLGSRICVSHLNFESIPEPALARLHPDYVQLHPNLSLAAQHEGNSDMDTEKQRKGLALLTDALEKARPVCDKTIVPAVQQARLIPTLWPLAVDYILGDYIKPESQEMDYEFDEVAQ